MLKISKNEQWCFVGWGIALPLGDTWKSLWRASARPFHCSSFTRGRKLIKKSFPGGGGGGEVQLHNLEGVTKKVLSAPVWKWGASLRVVPC